MDSKAADDMIRCPDNDDSNDYLPYLFASNEDPASLIAKYNPCRGDFDLFTQLSRFMLAYSDYGKYDTIAAVLQHFPEFRASKLFVSTNFNAHLHAAVKAGSVAFLKLFLEDFGVHYDGDPDRDNLFAEACLQGNLEVMRYLHSICHISIHEKLILHAFKKGRSEVVRYLHLQFGMEPSDKEAIVLSAYKGQAIELVESCFYDFGVVNIKTQKTVEYAVYAAACTGDIHFLSTLADLFSVTCLIPSIAPNRTSPKKYHFYHSFLIFAKRNDLELVQYCVEVLKIALCTGNFNSELVHYVDMFSVCAANGAAELLAYLIKDVGLQPSLYKRLTGYEINEIVERDWPDETTKAWILAEITENDSKSSVRSDSEEDEVVKKHHFGMSS